MKRVLLAIVLPCLLLVTIPAASQSVKGWGKVT